jgi:hypothetical protein
VKINEDILISLQTNSTVVPFFFRIYLTCWACCLEKEHPHAQRRLRLANSVPTVDGDTTWRGKRDGPHALISALMASRCLCNWGHVIGHRGDSLTHRYVVA